MKKKKYKNCEVTTFLELEIKLIKINQVIDLCLHFVLYFQKWLKLRWYYSCETLLYSTGEESKIGNRKILVDKQRRSQELGQGGGQTKYQKCSNQLQHIIYSPIFFVIF